MPTVTITISPAGESQIAVDGVSGPGCRDLTRALERAIGTTTKDEDVKTSDMNRPQGHGAGQAAGQGQEMPA